MSDIRAVRKYAAQHDLFNRVHSISADERFVKEVAGEWFDNRFEVVPNQRCGNWYCDPSTSSKAYAYFKSTDGHMTQWDFNLRRSNLNLAKYAEDRGGLILVDSTRRGKRMPDGLSKTVPIWCGVINLAIELRRDLSVEEEWDTELYLPPKVVSPSEKAQIEERLDEWAETLERSALPLPNLTKPLRPFFIHPSTFTPPIIPRNPPYTPIICLSASRWVNNTSGNTQDQIPSVTRLGDSRTVGFDYVPGAGDDDELWARGLTPSLFHSNKEELLSSERDDLPSLVDDLVLSSSMSKLPISNSSISNPNSSSNSASSSSISDNAAGIPSPSSRIALNIGTPIIPPTSKWTHSTSIDTISTIRIVEYEKYPKSLSSRLIRMSQKGWVLVVANSKTEGKAYENTIKELVDFVKNLHDQPVVFVHGSKGDVEKAIQITELRNAEHGNKVEGNKEIQLDEPPSPSVEGRKLILPIILALICAIPNLNSNPNNFKADKDGNEEEERKEINKDYISTKLHSLISLWPDGNPPRSSLKRVNEFLMSDNRR